MGTQGYAAPEYIMTGTYCSYNLNSTQFRIIFKYFINQIWISLLNLFCGIELFSGHLTAMSDVYSFGVVLLELLTGRRSVDKNRPHREQNLVEWAKPMLKEPRKLSRIMDPRLEGQYSEIGARMAAALAYQCISHRPKQRPKISDVVKILEPLKDFDDIPIAFVYTVPTESDSIKDVKEGDAQKELKKKNNHHQQNHQGHKHHQLKSPKSPHYYSENMVHQNHRNNGLKSPLHQRGRGI